MKYILSLLAVLFCSPVWAQDALVVTTCGTLSLTYTAGSTRLLTVDTNGRLCSYNLAAGITIGTSAITGGTDTRVLFDDGGKVGENAGLTFTKATGTLSATLGAFLGGNNTSIPAIYGAGATNTGIGLSSATDLDIIVGGTRTVYFDNAGVNSIVPFKGGVVVPTGAIISVPGLTAPVLTSAAAITTGAGASTGTLTNAPAVGNPTKWIPIDDNGTTRYIPAW